MGNSALGHGSQKGKRRVEVKEKRYPFTAPTYLEKRREKNPKRKEKI